MNSNLISLIVYCSVHLATSMISLGALLHISVTVFIAAALAADDQLHIVLILIDDLGWANVGYHRDPPTAEVDTPNIDSLVEQGLRRAA